MGRIWVDFVFQAGDGIRDGTVTGVQTCALPIWFLRPASSFTPVPVIALLETASEVRFASARSEERRVGKESSTEWKAAPTTKIAAKTPVARVRVSLQAKCRPAMARSRSAATAPT